MPFSQYIGRIALAFIVLYFLEFCASHISLYGSQNIIDTNHVEDSLFDSESRMVVLDRILLKHSSKKIVLVGASSTKLGLRPNDLAPYFPGVEIHNMSISGANIKEFGQTIQLILDAVPQESHKDLTIVLCVLYGSFVDDKVLWKNRNTQIEDEMLAYDLYRKSGAHFYAPITSDENIPYVGFMFRPFIWASHLYSQFKKFKISQFRLIEGSITLNTIKNDDITNNTHVVTAADREFALKSWMETMGPLQDWSDEGFKQLVSITKNVSSSGARIVLFDMPIPSWHRKQSPYDRIYQERLQHYLAQLSSIPGFSYVSMREKCNDDDFYDSAHPRPRVTHQWAGQAAHLILPALTK